MVRREVEVAERSVTPHRLLAAGRKPPALPPALLEPKREELPKEKITGTAYIGPGKDGKYVIGLYNGGRHIKNVEIGVDEPILVDEMRITLSKDIKGEIKVSIQYLS